MAVLQFSSSAYNYTITLTTAAAATTTTTRRYLRSHSCYPKVEMSTFIGLRMLTLMDPAVCCSAVSEKRTASGSREE
jgi:hypothetical protein